MSVTCTINGMRRLNPGTERAVLLVDLTLGTSHQMFAVNEASLLAAGDTAAQRAYITSQALASVSATTYLATAPPEFSALLGTTTLTGSVPMAGMGVAQRAITASDSILATDYAIWANATAGQVVVTLPTAVGNAGQRFEVKKTDTSANAVVLTPAGSEKIDGASTYTIAMPQKVVVVTSNGVGWIAS